MKKISRIAVVLLGLGGLLAAAPGRAAVVTTAWATADGAGPARFLDHHLGRDSAAGPNGSVAVGRWEGAARHGSYAGIPLSLAPGPVSRVEVLLAVTLTAPLTTNRLEVRLETASGTVGPVFASTALLNERVGAPGVIAVNLSLLREFSVDDLLAPVEVRLACKRRGLHDGAELHLDAVGVRVTQNIGTHASALAEIFDLRVGQQAALMDGALPLAVDVSAPVEIAAADCPEPVCYLQVVDSADQPQAVKVALMPDGQTVRVGFDDGRWAAPVDAWTSSVTADATAPADGVTAARVVVRVRDAGGWPLGGYLALRLDAAALGPAGVDGDLVDRGDGTYEIRLVSVAEGTAQVLVTVEGVVLVDAPTVSFVRP